MTAPVVILGPQRPVPNLADALAALDFDGPVGLITAGWRVDEDEVGPLLRHVQRDVRHLRLYAEVEAVLQTDPELAAAYHARQLRIRAYKDVYRISLRAAAMAVGELWDRVDADPELYGPDLDDAIGALRLVDERLLERVDAIRAAHPDVARPWERPAMRLVHERMLEQLDGIGALLVAGGHVAVLRNRLRMLGLDEAIRALPGNDVPILAWSAGAMVLSRRIALYYDDPPEGHGDAEVFGRGLDMLPGVVWLPHARMRLDLDDRRNVSTLARRLRPERAVALEGGAWLSFDGSTWTDRSAEGGCFHLAADGALVPGPGLDDDDDLDGPSVEGGLA